MSRISWEEIAEIFENVRITFSINCHSGLAYLLGIDHKCGCWRCKKERGEPSDEATEAQAAADSRTCQILQRQRIAAQLAHRTK